MVDSLRATLLAVSKLVPAGKLWTLYKDHHTASAEIHEIDRSCMELNYLQDGKIVAFIQSMVASDLLRDAAVERFELEARGWRADKPRAHRPIS